MFTRIIAGTIAAVAIFMSIALSVEQNLAVGQPMFLAWGLPVVFVGFVNLIFEVGWGLFIRAHQGAMFTHTRLKKDLIPEGMKIVRLRYFGGVVCIVASLLLESVNVVTIMGAQVNAMQNLLKQSVTVASTDVKQDEAALTADKIELINNKAKAETDWKARKAELTRTMNALYPVIADRVASPEYADLKSQQQAYDTKASEYDKKIETKQTEIEAARKTGLSAKTTESVSRQAYVGSIYTFIGTIFHSDPVYVQFWMAALPSLFLGIISCIALSLAMYGKDKKEAKE